MFFPHPSVDEATGFDLRIVAANHSCQLRLVMRSNLLLFGCDFFPTRKTSEINFWFDVIGYLESSFSEIVIVSVNNRPVHREQLSQSITLYNVPPRYFGNSKNWSDPEYTGKRFHRLPFSVLYKTATFLTHLKLIDSLIKRHQIGVVHYMRVFGLLNESLTWRHPGVVFTMTVPTHIDRGFPLHHLYHRVKRLGFRGMDKLIATSGATSERLISLGISPERIAVIPWSSGRRNTGLKLSDDRDVRQRLAISDQVHIALWSGPLQDTGEREFRYALEVAKSVVERSDQYHFVFAFKVDGLKKEYRTAASNITRIAILETNHDVFGELQRAARLFLSPICNRKRTVAPPLTWIEMMQRGVPVLTTNVDGVTELIIHEQTGFVVDGISATVELLTKLKATDLVEVGKRARQIVAHRYSLKHIAEAYVHLWELGREEKRARPANSQKMA